MTTKLPASVGIATTGDVGTTGGNRGAMTAAILVVVVVVAGRDAGNSVRSAEAAEIAIVVSAAVVADVTGIAIPDLANCPSLRKACA